MTEENEAQTQIQNTIPNAISRYSYSHYKKSLREYIKNGKSRSEIYNKYRYMRKEGRLYVMGLLDEMVKSGSLRVKMVRRVDSPSKGGRPCLLYVCNNEKAAW